MRIKKIFVLSILYFLISTCLLAYEGKAEPKDGTHSPVISHAFAVDKGYYGSIWRIYIEAGDPDGDMLRISSVVEQPGYGTYPTDWIYLKPRYQKTFRGYIQWNTFSSKTSYLKEWTQITIKVSVIDKAGNVSNEVGFPFTFEYGTKPTDVFKRPEPFDQGDLPRLGYINIDLFEPAQMGDGDGGGGQN